jgi:hypothetical protein
MKIYGPDSIKVTFNEEGVVNIIARYHLQAHDTSTMHAVNYYPTFYAPWIK